MSVARKPVIVRKLSRDWSAGYAAANPAAEPELELLDLGGRLLRLEWSQIKWVCYVRELAAEGEPTQQPERLLRRNFSSRPRVAGLWLRLLLEDGDELEGIAANDRTLIEGAGLLLTPPDTRSNTQRIFIPRSAVRELSVLAVIALKPQPEQAAGRQSELFAAENSSEYSR